MNTLPLNAGISLKPQHYSQILSELNQSDTNSVGWFEVHPENYMCAGGKQHFYLSQICQHYPLSMHGVGMSLGSAETLNMQHLKRWQVLHDQYQPACVSEHLAWTQLEGQYSNDLLPVHYTHEALNYFCRNIEQMQNALGRKILIENPSVYINLDNSFFDTDDSNGSSLNASGYSASDYSSSDYNEGQFLSAAIEKTGCGLLLDINNIKVSSHNLGINSSQLLQDYPLEHLGEIHLAGHSHTQLSDGSTLLIDNHGSQVCDEVWQLYKTIITQLGKPIATLIEWDTDIPALATLISEAQKVNHILQPFSVDEASAL